MGRVAPMPPGMWQRMTPEARRKHLRAERIDHTFNVVTLALIPPFMMVFVYELVVACSKGPN